MENRLRVLLIINYSLLILTSCSVQKQIDRSAKRDVINDSSFLNAHVGISIYEPAADKYLYNYQGDKYFVPASNTKIPTCYAAMKYLGDSLVGLKYGIPEEKWFKENIIVIQPAGDPSFLHSDFSKQPAFDFIQKISKEKLEFGFYYDGSIVERWGDGWSWNDYQASYMAERNMFPIFGNTLNIQMNNVENRFVGDTSFLLGYKIKLLNTGIKYFDSILNKRFRSFTKEKFYNPIQKFNIERDISNNSFFIAWGGEPFSGKVTPFVTNGSHTTIEVLRDSLKKPFTYVFKAGDKNEYEWASEGGDLTVISINKWSTIYSQPTDSVLKPMMHHSDNFFAEQSLLMVSNERLGIMNDEKIIDTILKTDFKDLPQNPRWVDGSGLSRYNLFTPQSLIAILNKMKNEFGMPRIKVILPTGGEGTISNYYKTDSGYIYAKTGTLSGVVALSGFLYTKKNKLLIFSVLVNNHRADAVEIRRAVEKFLEGVRDKY